MDRVFLFVFIIRCVCTAHPFFGRYLLNMFGIEANSVALSSSDSMEINDCQQIYDVLKETLQILANFRQIFAD